MKALTRTFNFATPFGGFLALLMLAGIALLIVAALNSFGFRFDPLNRTETRADRAEQTAAHASADAKGRGLEAAGATDTLRRSDAAHAQIRAADAVPAILSPQVRAAPDANQSLAADRLRVLHVGNERLCLVRPSACADRAGAAAAPDDAGAGA